MEQNVNLIIANRRKELGLTLEDIAKIVNVSKGTVSRWESGEIDNMRRDKIALLANALKISPLVLMGMNEKNAHPSTAPTSMPDAVKKLEEIKSYFSSAAALGEGMSEEDKALLLAAIEPTILQAKAAARKKFTPKKYRKS